MNFIADQSPKTKVFRIPLKLTPKQQEIFENPARYKIIRAGRKFGKTTYALYQALKWLAPPNSKVWFLTSTYKSGKLIAWSEIKKLIPQEAMKRKPNDTDLTIMLKNGSEFSVLGTDDMDLLRGPAPDGVIFDEAATQKGEVWYEVIRPNLMPKKAPALFISTPKGFNWFKDLEDKAIEDIPKGDSEWAVYHFTVYDNPTIDQEEISKAKRDCEENDAVWRQEYMAEYESGVGRVFASFSDARHVSAVPKPDSLSCGRAVDWGMRDDTACLWGYPVSEDGKIKLKVYREYAANNLPARTQANIILGMTPMGEHVDRNIIGHDADKQDVQLRGLTVKWHFSTSGMTPLRVGGKDKKGNRSMIQQLVVEDRLVIDKSCQKLRKQMLAYEWKDTAMEKTEDGNDDLVDALHSLVELYQYDLFQSRSQEKELTITEKYLKIAEERKRQRHHFPLDQDKESAYSFEGTAAGYIS